MLKALISWISFEWFHFCQEHKRKLEVYSEGTNKWDYGLISYISCRECRPDLFDKDYFKNLKRFDIPKTMRNRKKTLAK